MNDWDHAVSLPVASMMTGLSHWTIRRAISLGRLPAEKRGREKFVRIEDLHEWAEAKKGGKG